MSDQYFEQGDEGVVIDLDAIEAASNEVIPKGTYPGVIEELEYKLSAASGKPMWAYVVTIIEGEYTGRKLYGNLSFSPKALPVSKKTLLDLCPQYVTAGFNPKAIADEGHLIGLEVRVKTKIGKNEANEPRTEIAGLSKAPDLTGGGFVNY